MFATKSLDHKKKIFIYGDHKPQPDSKQAQRTYVRDKFILANKAIIKSY